MPRQIKASSPLDPAIQRKKEIWRFSFCDRQQIDLKTSIEAYVLAKVDK